MASCGTITVEAAFNTSDVTEAGCSVGGGSGTVLPGENVQVSLQVQNANDVEVSCVIEMFIDGQSVASRTVDVPANQTVSYTLNGDAPNTPGSYSAGAQIRRSSIQRA